MQLQVAEAGMTEHIRCFIFAKVWTCDTADLFSRPETGVAAAEFDKLNIVVVTSRH